MDSELLTGVFSGGLALVLLTSFVRIFVSLTILRYGLGLTGGGLGFILAVVAFALATVSAAPALRVVGVESFSSIVELASSGSKRTELEAALRPAMEANTDTAILNKISQALAKNRAQVTQVSESAQALDQSIDNTESSQTVAPQAATQTAPQIMLQPKDADFPLLSASFLITELRTAFRIGLLFIIPFLVVDLLLANIFLVLGVNQLPVSTVAIPIKLLIFVAVDGWTLVALKLLQ